MVELLEARYRVFHREAELPKRLARRALPPLLVYPHTRWHTAKVRLLIVGQETLTWRYDPAETGGPGEPILNFSHFVAAPEGVEAMWELYRCYALGRHKPKMNSAFWRGFRALDSAVNGKVDSALWTNLFKVNVQGSVMRNCKRAEIARLHTAQQGLLRFEIEVLRPDVVVFFTGPRYDRAICQEFPDADFEPVGRSFPASSLAFVRARGLPVKTVRTFHPEYLQRSRQMKLLQTIADWAGG